MRKSEKYYDGQAYGLGQCFTSTVSSLRLILYLNLMLNHISI